MSAASPNKHIEPFVQIGFGEALFNLNRLPEADVYLKKSLDLFLSRKQFKGAMEASHLLAASQKKQSRLGDALGFREQWGALKDSLFREEREKIVQEATFKFETREKMAQIISLKKEARLADEGNFWILGFLLLLAGLGFWFTRFRHRNQQTILEKDLALQTAKTESAARELDLHRQQLADFAQHLQAKTEQLIALQTDVKSAATQTDGTESPEDEGHEPAAANSKDEDLEALF